MTRPDPLVAGAERAACELRAKVDAHERVWRGLLDLLDHPTDALVADIKRYLNHAVPNAFADRSTPCICRVAVTVVASPSCPIHGMDAEATG